jgi:hypothetical protein
MLLVLPVLTRSLTADHDSWAHLILRVRFAGATILCP